jgi:hypothetical protein
MTLNKSSKEAYAEDNQDENQEDDETKVTNASAKSAFSLKVSHCRPPFFFIEYVCKTILVTTDYLAFLVQFSQP